LPIEHRRRARNPVELGHDHASRCIRGKNSAIEWSSTISMEYGVRWRMVVFPTRCATAVARSHVCMLVPNPALPLRVVCRPASRAIRAVSRCATHPRGSRDSWLFAPGPRSAMLSALLPRHNSAAWDSRRRDAFA
jgi:hypothetical protein